VLFCGITPQPRRATSQTSVDLRRSKRERPSRSPLSTARKGLAFVRRVLTPSGEPLEPHLRVEPVCSDLPRNGLAVHHGEGKAPGSSTGVPPVLARCFTIPMRLEDRQASLVGSHDHAEPSPRGFLRFRPDREGKRRLVALDARLRSEAARRELFGDAVAESGSGARARLDAALGFVSRSGAACASTSIVPSQAG